MYSRLIVTCHSFIYLEHLVQPVHPSKEEERAVGSCGQSHSLKEPLESPEEHEECPKEVEQPS